MAMLGFMLAQWGGLQGSSCSNGNVRRFSCYLWCNQCLFQAKNLKDCTYHLLLQGHNLQRWEI